MNGNRCRWRKYEHGALIRRAGNVVEPLLASVQQVLGAGLGRLLVAVQTRGVELHGDRGIADLVDQRPDRGGEVVAADVLRKLRHVLGCDRVGAEECGFVDCPESACERVRQRAQAYANSPLLVG